MPYSIRVFACLKKNICPEKMYLVSKLPRWYYFEFIQITCMTLGDRMWARWEKYKEINGAFISKYSSKNLFGQKKAQTCVESPSCCIYLRLFKPRSLGIGWKSNIVKIKKKTIFKNLFLKTFKHKERAQCLAMYIHV